ncbi:unnamed protein product [Cyprideis torosa]|uniref:Uncharacterized protein n=1 Tax=Cyprideis torosa TaxID=163714 RepID=A0A7R8WG66_9CRUS|nr:unnamed protein product [Cyprideis torosa]CAG0891738.1 unnamed protein product [Cyprideis torosa]
MKLLDTLFKAIDVKVHGGFPSLDGDYFYLPHLEADEVINTSEEPEAGAVDDEEDFVNFEDFDDEDLPIHRLKMVKKNDDQDLQERKRMALLFFLSLAVVLAPLSFLDKVLMFIFVQWFYATTWNSPNPLNIGFSVDAVGLQHE